MARTKKSAPEPELEADPLWYQHAVIYELHVRAFHDSNGDGIGDFPGLTEKLDYLQDLGVTALWLLPFYPSPLRDDGYDIADYTSIHPDYGTLADFKVFLREAHRRGLRVITELVVNHTSDQHPWFQRARRAAPGTRWRSFYVWSKTGREYRDARVIFKDFERSNWTFDPVAGEHYWHRFYSHQPDLNYDVPEVHEEILKALDFWLDLGVDGLRLDAVPYLYEREGTSCENLPETHDFLKKLRRHVDERYRDRMLLAEANQWPEDAVRYFGAGSGDECHMAFHFPVMPRLFMAVRQEDRTPIVDILEQTPPIPATCQWAVFLRNHDELTLEMVSDEERDYMYRVYASDRRARINLGIRRRLAPLLGNDRRRMELLNALLLSLPGTPVLYYGDEIAMGDNVFLGDRNGVRTPMQWSSERNAGFSRANPQSLYLPVIVDPEYHHETVNVENQRRNPHSLLWWMKRLLALRKRWRVFGDGTVTFLQTKNRKILAFVRATKDGEPGGERILVVANLSRFAQPFRLDLSAHAGKEPVELFGRTRFPRVGQEPYFLTLGPHSFAWFSLETPEARAATGEFVPPALRATETLEELLETDRLRGKLERVLQPWLERRRWFGGKSKEIRSIQISERVQVPHRSGPAFLCALTVDYVQHDPERYLLPLWFATGDDAARVLANAPHLVVARAGLGRPAVEGLLCDAVASEEFCGFLLEAVRTRKRLKGARGTLVASATPVLRAARDEEGDAPHTISIGKGEQSNTTIVFGGRWILKLFRKLDSGVNPDLEISRYLTARRFPGSPPMGGALECIGPDSQPTSIGILARFIPNSKDAWTYTLDALGRYFERVQSLPAEARSSPACGGTLARAIAEELPEHVEPMLGTFLESLRLLGVRTAELHLALASDPDDPDFAPEAFTVHYQRSLFAELRKIAVENLALLRDQMGSLPEDAKPLAEKAAALEGACIEKFRAIVERRIQAQRIRTHGDFHLGQVLHTGKDFAIMDFEGEPARALSERRIKRSPLRDVAGMLRSFHYAAYTALEEQRERGLVQPSGMAEVEPWARYWQRWASAVYLKAYLERAKGQPFLPASSDELWTLLDAYVLEKAIYEIGYELNNRPGWVRIPLQGLLQLVAK